MADEPKSFWGKLALVSGFFTAIAALLGTLYQLGVFEKTTQPTPAPAQPPAPVATSRPAPSPAPGRWFQDRCLVEGTVLLIDNHGDIMPAGRSAPGGHPRCAFDIIGPDKTYCVNREDGEVLLQDGRGSWYSVGFCQKCEDIGGCN